MGPTYWHKQTPDQPLFPDLLWSRPENRVSAGKLLIVGGNGYEFAAPAEAYGAATKAGIGAARVLLPDSLRHTVGRVLEAGDFAPSTPSGSFSQRALSDLLASAAWADGVLLAGDFGRNSETAILLEKFTEKYSGQLTITKDAADYWTSSPGRILEREDTLLAVSFAQLQKLAVNAHFTSAFTFDMGLVRLVEQLHAFTSIHRVHVVVKHLDAIVVAVDGEVSTTKLAEDMPVWRVKIAAHASTWWLQNPSQAFQAVTCGIYEFARSG